MALVGHTGAGKSTVAALVPRLMDPQRGAVLLDGIDVRSLRVESLRWQVSLVLQDCVLYRRSLRENSAMGRPGASDAAVVRAARLALVDQFAARLPAGLDTPVGERGADLSGGQRQRVAIARAILRDAPILTWTSPRAPSTERPSSSSQALANLPAQRTTLVIAHRFSTIRDADPIVVLQSGRIVEEGHHEQLISCDGPYRRLSGPLAAVGPATCH